jgi:hypothetical protein
MAIATSTALAIGGLAVSAASTGMSFAQANKQKKLQREAEADAQKAMAEARKKLDVNYYDQLAIQKEPYELEREAALSAGAQAIQAGVEGDRGAAATAGRVQMAQNEQQAGIRTSMGKELTDLALLSASEDSRLRDVGVQLDLEEAAGAQLAARDAQEARTAAMQQGMEGLTSTVQQGVAAVPLFGQDLGAQKSAIQKSIGDKSLGDFAMQDYKGQAIGNIDFTNMSNMDYRRFRNSLSPDQRQQLFSSQAYIQNYNPFQPF